jgi:hypothetical protein
VEKFYEACVNCLKDHVSYCFTLRKPHPERNWSISTWCNRISASSIMKMGREQDKLLLQQTSRTQVGDGQDGRSNKRRRTPKAAPLYPQRARTYQEETQQSTQPWQTPGRGHCSLGLLRCKFPELDHSHVCHGCRRNYMHSLCACQHSLHVEGNESILFCSELCQRNYSG